MIDVKLLGSTLLGGIFMAECIAQSMPPVEIKNNPLIHVQQMSEQQQELETVYRRYVNWIVGSGTLSKSDPLVHGYHDEMLRVFAEVEAQFVGWGGGEGLGKISFAPTKDQQPEAR